MGGFMFDWILKGLFKIFVVIFIVGIAWSFVAQMFSPAKRDANAQAQLPPTLEQAQAGQSGATVLTPASAVGRNPITQTHPSVKMDPNAEVSKASYKDVDFQINDVTGQGPAVIIRLTAVNHGVDRELDLPVSMSWLGGPVTEIYDERGDVYHLEKARIGDVATTYETESLLVSGVPTRVVLTVGPVPTVRGITEPSKVRLAAIALQVFAEDRQMAYRERTSQPPVQCEFRNLDVLKRQ
jgi:hypothetical protein